MKPQHFREVLWLLAVLGLLTFANALHNPFLIDDRVFFSPDNTGWEAVKKAFVPQGT